MHAGISSFLLWDAVRTSVYASVLIAWTQQVSELLNHHLLVFEFLEKFGMFGQVLRVAALARGFLKQRLHSGMAMFRGTPFSATL